MTTISTVSATWLADTWTTMQNDMRASGGMLGALQNARKSNGTVKGFLFNSANGANAFALIAQNSVADAGSLTAQVAVARRQQEQADKLKALASLAPSAPPKPLVDPIIFFENGSTLDTVNNVLTLTDGKKIDAITGAEVIDSTSIVNFANGSYLDTKKNILTLADGTKIDTVTGLIVSTTA
jgi:hypothetical protein